MITIDATALTLDSFHLSGIGILETGAPQVLTLAPGTYRFGTLFGPSFEFSVTEADTVGYNADLTFLEGVGTDTLRVIGCRIEVDATALTLDSFTIADPATGLGEGEYFPTNTIQTLMLIPGAYRFATIRGPGFIFSVEVTRKGTCTVSYHPSLMFLKGFGSNTLRVIGCRIEVDATALTLDSFTIADPATGLGEGEHFPTNTIQTLTLIPGAYRFATIRGPGFVFSVEGTCTVSYHPSLMFLEGFGSNTLRVIGCRIEVDATALTLDSFTVADHATGLGEGDHRPTNTIQTFTLIPGAYRFATVRGPGFVFSVEGTCTISYHPSLMFLEGFGSNTLRVNGFLLSVDATRLTLPSFTLSDALIDLHKSFGTTAHQCVTLIPGPYVFICGFAFRFSVNSAGLFEYDASLDPRCVGGHTTQRLRVSCAP